MLLSYIVNLVYQFWIHTDLIGKLGWMEGVLNTPSAHRVHHAANVEYLDCNDGGTIMLFDRIFGTYVTEQDGVPIRYGLVKPQTSNSALKICLAEWWAMVKDLRKVRGPRDLVGYLFGPPGWAPNGEGLTTEDLACPYDRADGAAGRRAAGVVDRWPRATRRRQRAGDRVQRVAISNAVSQRRACSRESPHISAEGCSEPHTAGRSG